MGFNLKGLISENSWLAGQLAEVKEALAACLWRSFPPEALWLLLAMLAFHLLVDIGRVMWHRRYPAARFPWDM